MKVCLRGCVATLVVLGTALMLAGSASAQAVVTAGPAGGRETETWQVVQPRCTIAHDWQKSPTAVDVRSIAFTAGVWCQAVPSNLTVSGWLAVRDETNNGAVVLSRSAQLDPSASPESFSLTPVLSNPKPGHAYESEFAVSFVDNVNFSVEGVSGTPPQCQTKNPSGPFPSGPVPQAPPSVDCQFVEALVVP
jgi:hypothetical protein